ncbi:prepilin-type N-terminal cleavage/methylation domain-containing protein [Mycoplasmatota bacterium]|nr:prepilin-type N-terminal cleavage/methylation domain-containing protein [Mycoplasmatota bacterium]
MNKRGFTLTELMIVLIIISGLMYLVIPNITSTKSSLDNKTCKAYIELVNTQIQAYRIDNDELPIGLQTLVDEKYIKSDTCPDGSIIKYENGVASIQETETTP